MKNYFKYLGGFLYFICVVVPAYSQSINPPFIPQGSGTVTSVGVGNISGVTTSGSPVTTNGTVTQTLNSQTANTVFAAPNGSAGAPTFRALLPADLGSQTANTILAAPNGSAGTPTFRTIVTGDLPSNFVNKGNPIYFAGLTIDGYSAGDGAISSGTATFTSAGRSCVGTDAGKIIVIAGAGASNAPLQTTISSCSGANYTLAISAGSTVSSAQWGMGTDNSAALNTLVANNPGAEIVLPPGMIALNANNVSLTNISIRGSGQLANRVAAFGALANQGTTFLLTSASVTPFTVHQSVKLSGLNFFWPGQSGIISTPVAYPPLFVDSGVDQLSDFTVSHSSIINAYDLFTQNAAAVVMGGVRFDSVNAYAIHRAFSLSVVGETIYVNASLFNPSVAYNLANVGNQYLGKWTIANGQFLYVFGTGTSSTCATSPMGGMIVSGGTTINGYAQLILVNGGWIDETQFGDGDYNGIGQILVVNANGQVTRTRFAGRYYPNGQFGVTTTGSAFDFESTCTGQQGDVVVNANIVAPQAGVFTVNGSNLYNLDINASVIANYAGNTSASPVYLLTANNSNARITMSASKFYPANLGANYRGVLITSAYSLNYVGNNCYQTYYCVDTSGATTTGGTNIVGNISTSTQSTYTLNGTLTATNLAYANKFDIPNTNYDGLTGPYTATNSVDLSAYYYVPTSGSHSFTIGAGQHSVEIDSAVNGITAVTATLPTAPADGYVVRFSADSAITTFTITPGTGDLSACGTGALASGAAVGCIFRKGIGATSPNGKWFTY